MRYVVGGSSSPTYHRGSDGSMGLVVYIDFEFVQSVAAA